MDSGPLGRRTHSHAGARQREEEAGREVIGACVSMKHRIRCRVLQVARASGEADGEGAPSAAGAADAADAGGGSGGGRQITPTGRYVHSRQYLRDVAVSSGFIVVRMESSVLRRQKGEDVRGLLVVLHAAS
mmetsp:Transcript_17052/g.30901  ORF Transcript_17052/g.30901 Transcript_17052/m.30901 type:complete len:131 (-) Transcript_17052:21-413(-)